MPNEDFESFFRDDFPRLVGFLITMGYPPAVAEDAAAETMYLALRRWDEILTPRAWVRRVGNRKAMRQSERDAAGVRRAVEGGWVPISVVHDLANLIDAQATRLKLLAELPDRQREVMAWTFDGFTPTEIAHELGMPADTVRSNLRHARTTLKRVWKQLNSRTEGGA